MSDPIPFSERRRKLLEERGQVVEQAPQPQGELPADLAKDIPDNPYEQTEFDREIDRTLDNVSILEAYVKWCGKTIDQSTIGRTEGVKVSCPKPSHPDNNPSAWINTDKGVWHCGGCDEGGDKYDIAAYNKNYPVPGYKDNADFGKLRREMAEDFGFRSERRGNETVVWHEPGSKGAISIQSETRSKTVQPPEQEPEPEPDLVAPTPIPVVHQDEEDEDEEEEIVYRSVPWREIVPPDTFLYEYLSTCSKDTSPEEYHFWHGLVAVGMATERKVSLDDDKPVRPSLSICLLGGTGYGKSRSRAYLDECLSEVLPFKDDGLSTSGVKNIKGAGSGEVLISHFNHEAKDPSLPPGKQIFTPISGVIEYDEMKQLLAVANRQGSTMKQVLMGIMDNQKWAESSSRTHGITKALEPFASVVSSTQPKSVRTFLAKDDTASGFLNRWIFAGGVRKKQRALGGRSRGIEISLDTAKTELKRIRGWSGKGRLITLDDAAYEVFEKFFHDQIEPMQQKANSDLLNRLDLIFKKLILLFAINEHKEVVDADLVKRVTELYEYLIFCYGIIDKQIGITITSEIAEEIEAKVRRFYEKHKRGMTGADLRTALRRKKYSPDQIEKTLRTLRNLEVLDLAPREKIGRPADRYIPAGVSVS